MGPYRGLGGGRAPDYHLGRLAALLARLHPSEGKTVRRRDSSRRTVVREFTGAGPRRLAVRLRRGRPLRWPESTGSEGRRAGRRPGAFGRCGRGRGRLGASDDRQRGGPRTLRRRPRPLAGRLVGPQGRRPSFGRVERPHTGDMRGLPRAVRASGAVRRTRLGRPLSRLRCNKRGRTYRRLTGKGRRPSRAGGGDPAAAPGLPSAVVGAPT